MSYPDMIQYVIHTLLLFILFLYWVMLKNIAVAIIKHTEEASHRQSQKGDNRGTSTTLDLQEMMSHAR